MSDTSTQMRDLVRSRRMALGEMLARNARQYPDKTALVFEGKALTFGELNSRVNRLAAALVRRGVTHGSNVAVLMFNKLEVIESYFACQKLGACPVPVNFRLAGASAFFRRDFDHGVEAAKVDNGMLSVDFSRSTFSTQLGVSSPTLGADNVSASGTIGKDGVMRSTSANAIVQGATTLDGKEAGYLFEKNLASGALRGVTLWGR